MPKEILVTSQGMLGRYIDSDISSRGFEVDVTTSQKEKISLKDGIYHVEATDPNSIEKIISQGYKAIINMMAVADPRLATEQPEYADEVNHQSVVTMLESIKKMDPATRPVVILACSVLQYDIISSGLVRVDHPIKKVADPYIDSKNKMLISALPYLSEGVDIRFAFIGNTTGEGHSLGYFPTDMADQLIKGETVVHGPIEHKRPFLHGKDAARMIFYGLTHLDSGSRFLVTGKHSLSLRDFLNTMISVSGKKDVELVYSDKFGPPPKVSDVNFDISNLEHFGYQQILGVPDICRTLLEDRYRVSCGKNRPTRGVVGY